MNEEVDFKTFHRYNKLVRRGFVQPLTCKTCAAPYVTAMDKDDNLVLRCLACESVVRPGAGTLARVNAIVAEHFVREEEE